MARVGDNSGRLTPSLPFSAASPVNYGLDYRYVCVCGQSVGILTWFPRSRSGKLSSLCFGIWNISIPKLTSYSSTLTVGLQTPSLPLDAGLLSPLRHFVHKKKTALLATFPPKIGSNKFVLLFVSFVSLCQLFVKQMDHRVYMRNLGLERGRGRGDGKLGDSNCQIGIQKTR
ncbi:hypothetical protein BGZ63DRAFT_385081 [Mariannaea sp. PMI_226]|nr:hypothetical protein BGZ63DRAFT_385081 [Mariannaea sp. PMI_226]